MGACTSKRNKKSMKDEKLITLENDFSEAKQVHIRNHKFFSNFLKNDISKNQSKYETSGFGHPPDRFLIKRPLLLRDILTEKPLYTGFVNDLQNEKIVPLTNCFMKRKIMEQANYGSTWHCLDPKTNKSVLIKFLHADDADSKKPIIINTFKKELHLFHLLQKSDRTSYQNLIITCEEKKLFENNNEYLLLLGVNCLPVTLNEMIYQRSLMLNRSNPYSETDIADFAISICNDLIVARDNCFAILNLATYNIHLHSDKKKYSIFNLTSAKYVSDPANFIIDDKEDALINKYTAPEIKEALNINKKGSRNKTNINPFKADCWGLGIIFLEMLGCPSFELNVLDQKIDDAEKHFFNTINNEIIRGIILKMTSINPSNRPSYEAIINEFRRIDLSDRFDESSYYEAFLNNQEQEGDWKEKREKVNILWKMEAKNEVFFDEIPKIISSIKTSLGGEENEVIEEMYMKWGLILSEKGALDESLLKFERALQIQISLYPKGEMKISQTFQHIGYIKELQGLPNEADSKYQNALDNLSDNVNKEEGAIYRIDLYSTLGLLRLNIREYDRALEAFENACEIYREYKILNRETEFGKLKANIGLLYIGKDKFEKAKEFLEEARHIFESRQQGLNDEYSAQILSNLALIFANEGQTELAVQYYENALQIRRKIYSTDHMSVANTLHNLGECLAAKKQNPKQAIICLEEALLIKKRLYRTENNNDILFTMKSLANIFIYIDIDFTKAKVLLDKMEKIVFKLYSESELTLLIRDIYYEHSYILHKLLQDSSAKEYFRKVEELGIDDWAPQKKITFFVNFGISMYRLEELEKCRSNLYKARDIAVSCSNEEDPYDNPRVKELNFMIRDLTI